VGSFIWVQLPKGARTEELLTLAVAQKVAFVPGKPFFAKRAAARVPSSQFLQSIERAHRNRNEATRRSAENEQRSNRGV